MMLIIMIMIIIITMIITITKTIPITMTKPITMITMMLMMVGLGGGALLREKSRDVLEQRAQEDSS